MVVVSKHAFGSVLTFYTPRPNTQEQANSKAWRLALKREQRAPSSSELMSQWVAKKVKTDLKHMPFHHFFTPNCLLVPVPKSSLMQKDELWVPYELAKALSNQNLGTVSVLLKRSKALAKSAFSNPANRPTYREHYDSLHVSDRVTNPHHIVLIDDVITAGTTCCACADKLQDRFPSARIVAFVAMRAMNEQAHFQTIFDPCVGTITLHDHFERCFREP